MLYIICLQKLEGRVASDEDLKLSDTLRYYMRDSAAAKNLLYRRLRALANYEAATKMLEKARSKNKDVQVVSAVITALVITIFLSSFLKVIILFRWTSLNFAEKDSLSSTKNLFVFWCCNNIISDADDIYIYIYIYIIVCHLSH